VSIGRQTLEGARLIADILKCMLIEDGSSRTDRDVQRKRATDLFI
jgi:hypothetical protein